MRGVFISFKWTAMKRKKADAEKFEAECMSLLSENYSANK